MKIVSPKFRTTAFLLFTIIGYTGYLASCTHEDQEIDEFVQGVVFSETELVSLKTTTAPTVDGEIEIDWDKAQKLITSATVPDPGDNFFAGEVGNTYGVTMRSMYDQEFIYFLVEWNDQTGTYNRQPWFFDPATKKWAQEGGENKVNANGDITRSAFGEDKFGVLWNVNKTVVDWNSATCYKSCHTGLGADKGFARHYTNSPTEKIDMWHWKSVRDNDGTMDDQYQDNTQPNGRKNDASTSGTGALDNRQSLQQPGIGAVNVPKYVIPGKENYYWIAKSEIDNKTAKLITSIDANGVLYYDGGSIDPNTDKAYQRDGSATGNKVIPSVTTSRLEGSRGDISAIGKHTDGKGWVLEIKRKLSTGDADVDVNFADFSDQYFGIGVFNNTGHSHAIRPNLVLKFD